VPRLYFSLSLCAIARDGFCVLRQCARSHRIASRLIRAANGWLDTRILRPIVAYTVNHWLTRFSFSLTRYVSEGDEAAAASGSDDDDDAEEEEVVEEEDAAPGKYKSTPPYARRERVTLLDICIM
jgi:hypothetical protein